MVIKGHNTTPASSKRGEGKPHAATTVGSKKLEAKFLHFETCFLQQDLLKKAEEIHTVLGGDDERAKKKILHMLRVISERLEKFNLLMQQSRECKDYICSKHSETNQAIKILQRNVPIEKRKSPEDVRLGQVLQEIGPACKKSKKSPPIASPPIGNEKVGAFIQETPPQNKSHYTYREIVTAIFIDKASQIYGHPIRKVYDGLKNKSLLICGRTALQNHINPGYVELAWFLLLQ
jgi:hypothetical protein